MKITENGLKNWHEIVREIFQKEKRTQKGNVEEINIRICLKKINKNLKNMKKSTLTKEK